MSGGGKIIDKTRLILTDKEDRTVRRDVVRFWLLTGESDDELWVYAEPQDDEPAIGDAIWWGGGSAIYWGPNDGKRLRKVGYSVSPERSLI